MARKRSIENLSIHAIDPSKRTCGWAVLRSNQICAGTATSKIRNLELSIRDISNQLIDENVAYLSDVFIIEKPIILPNWSENKISEIQKLLITYGALLTFGFDEDEYQPILWTPTAPEWKGQAPKAVTHKRAYKALKSAGIKIVSSNLDHNAKDAIALIATYLQKEGYID